MNLLVPETIDLKALPAVPMEQRESLPDASALYFVFDAADVVLYVGQANTLWGRWQQHEKMHLFLSFPSPRIAWILLDDIEALQSLESQCILFFQPQFNRKGKRPPTVLRSLAQGTVRIQRDKLRELRYYLNIEETNFTRFVEQKVDEFLHDYRQAHPERVPAGIQIQIFS